MIQGHDEDQCYVKHPELFQKHDRKIQGINGNNLEINKKILVYGDIQIRATSTQIR